MIKIVDWNINGGYLVRKDSVEKNFEFFVNKIKKLNPDIVLIQEGHISKEFNQIQELSKQLGLKHYIYEELCESHIEKNTQLCLFILSKYEIKSSNFFKLTNPNLISFNEKYGGEIRTDTISKGFLNGKIEINKEEINLITGHNHAFHIFNKKLDEYPVVLEEIKNYILKQTKSSAKMIFGADLNYYKIDTIAKNLFSNKVQNVFDNVITYKNKQYDHILISKNFKIINKKIDMCTNDHALLYFEIE